jgi:hypothetical protein
MSKKRPFIPERYSSLMPAARQEKLQDVKQRSSSLASQISLNSTASEFLEAKIRGVETEIEYITNYRTGLHEAFEAQNMGKAAFQEAMREVETGARPIEREAVLLKRQKKSLAEDLAEDMNKYETVDEAYVTSIIVKTMSAGTQQRRNFNQTNFRKAVLEYYGAIKIDAAKQEERYCHLTGWHNKTDIKAAHVVPKALESEELSHLFGVGEALLMDPKNGPSLNIYLHLQRKLTDKNGRDHIAAHN